MLQPPNGLFLLFGFNTMVRMTVFGERATLLVSAASSDASLTVRRVTCIPFYRFRHNRSPFNWIMAYKRIGFRMPENSQQTGF